MRTATRPVSVVGGLLRDVTRSREELIAENTLLRQQLIVAARTVKKPRFTAHERGLLVLLARLVPRWRDALLVVKPETVLRWHRGGFRLFWRVEIQATRSLGPPRLAGSGRSNPTARRREPAVGRGAYSRRTPEARYQGRQADYPEAHAPAPRAASLGAELVNVHREPVLATWCIRVRPRHYYHAARR